MDVGLLIVGYNERKQMCSLFNDIIASFVGVFKPGMTHLNQESQPVANATIK
ncbi:MAG: hypothetical protein WC810_26330 [Janthinobacterium sp.]|jgi:hypothetical protein